MARPPSASELAESYQRLSRRHEALVQAYETELDIFNRRAAQAQADAIELDEKRYLLAEEDRLCRRSPTRRAYRDQLRRDMSRLEASVSQPDDRPLRGKERRLRSCEKDMRAWVDYVQHCRTLEYV
ncbi:hypothetical protein QQS21_012180 [Conoideocrella luteorostrata]|uniref:Uncharacterized protein n=1 Tax=Conoideocrella luteorostrata TaxID=1105319 RepID=A0AAJ0CBP3_9HYPO|nr:hypothetical protein QQS21_012180 [Conoideocrella luteorostrata]